MTCCPLSRPCTGCARRLILRASPQSPSRRCRQFVFDWCYPTYPIDPGFIPRADGRVPRDVITTSCPCGVPLCASPTRLAPLLLPTMLLPCPYPLSHSFTFPSSCLASDVSPRCSTYSWRPTHEQWHPSRLHNFSRGRLFARARHYQRVPYPFSCGFADTRCFGYPAAFAGDSTLLLQ